jgi:hypothetical protein
LEPKLKLDTYKKKQTKTGVLKFSVFMCEIETNIEFLKRKAKTEG